MRDAADILYDGGRTLFVTPNHDDNNAATEALLDTGEPFEIICCPPNVVDLYRMPFINDPEYGRYFGLEGIRRFAATRHVDPLAGARQRMDDNLHSFGYNPV